MSSRLRSVFRSRSDAASIRQTVRKELMVVPETFLNFREKYLGLKTGAVSPFGVWNDTENKVIVIPDEELTTQEKIGVHPNDNTATVWLAPQTLRDSIVEKGNEYRVVKL